MLNSRETGTVHVHYPGDFNSVLIVRSEAARHQVFGSSQYDGRVHIELTGRWLEYIDDFEEMGFEYQGFKGAGWPFPRT